jgi:transposase
VYVDEAGIDDTEDYAYGYSPKGQRCYALKQGSKTTRVSMIAALHQKAVRAPMTFEGYCNTDVFECWLEQELLPGLPKGHTIILDNASFHKSQAIEKMVAEAGCDVLYLPPYSPDLNPIEHEWFPIKNRIRKTRDRFSSFREAVDNAFTEGKLL